MLAGIQFALNPGGGTTTPVPAAPAGLAARAITSSQVNLSWAASTTTGVTYNIYVGTQPGAVSVLTASGVSGTSYSVVKLSAGTTYYFVVKAANASGSSGASNQASAMTKASAVGSCHVAYVDQNDWGSGFTGNLSITTSVAGDELDGDLVVCGEPAGQPELELDLYADRQGGGTDERELEWHDCGGSDVDGNRVECGLFGNECEPGGVPVERNDVPMSEWAGIRLGLRLALGYSVE